MIYDALSKHFSLSSTKLEKVYFGIDANLNEKQCTSEDTEKLLMNLMRASYVEPEVLFISAIVKHKTIYRRSGYCSEGTTEWPYIQERYTTLRY